MQTLDDRKRLIEPTWPLGGALNRNSGLLHQFSNSKQLLILPPFIYFMTHSSACEERFYSCSHLRMLGNPVSQHIENSVGCGSSDDEFFVTGSLRITES